MANTKLTYADSKDKLNAAGGDPMSVRLEPSAPVILGVKKPFDEKSGGFSFNFGPAQIGPVHQVNSVKVGPGSIFL